MTQNANPNQAIVRTEFRETIVFSGIPSAETCKRLRASGFEYSRRDGQWYKRDLRGQVLDESAVVSSFAA